MVWSKLYTPLIQQSDSKDDIQNALKTIQDQECGGVATDPIVVFIIYF